MHPPKNPENHFDGDIVCTVQGAIVLIGINRPAKRSGFTPRMFDALARACTRLDDDPDLRAGLSHVHGARFTGR